MSKVWLRKLKSVLKLTQFIIKCSHVQTFALYELSESNSELLDFYYYFDWRELYESCELFLINIKKSNNFVFNLFEKAKSQRKQQNKISHTTRPEKNGEIWEKHFITEIH